MTTEKFEVALGEDLLRAGLLTPAQLAQAMYDKTETGLSLGEICLENGWMDLDQLYRRIPTHALRLGEILLLGQCITINQLQQVVSQQRRQPDTKLGDLLIQQLGIPQEAIEWAITEQENLRQLALPDSWQVFQDPVQLSSLPPIEAPSPPENDTAPVILSVESAVPDPPPASSEPEETSPDLGALITDVSAADIAAEAPELFSPDSTPDETTKTPIFENRQLQEQLALMEQDRKVYVEENHSLLRQLQEARLAEQENLLLIQHLTASNSQSQQRINHLEAVLSRFEEQEQQSQARLQADTEQLNQQITALQQEIEILQQQRQELEQRLAQDQNRLQELEQQSQQLANHEQQLQSKTQQALQQLKDQLAQAQEQIQAKTSDLQMLQDERADLQEDLAVARRQLDELELQRQTALDDATELSDQLTEQQQQEESLSAQLQQAETQIHLQSQEILQLQQQLKQAQAQAPEFKRRLTELQTQLTREQQQRKQLSLQLETLEKTTRSQPSSSKPVAPAPVPSSAPAAPAPKPVALQAKSTPEPSLADLLDELDDRSDQQDDHVPGSTAPTDLIEIEAFAQSTPWVQRVLTQLRAAALITRADIERILKEWAEQGGTFTETLSRCTGLSSATVKFFSEGGFSVRLTGTHNIGDYLRASGLVTDSQIQTAQAQMQPGQTLCEKLVELGWIQADTARYFEKNYGGVAGNAPKSSLLRERLR
ncbi:MAG: hypothetical protein HC921_12225 [Synechococcaceae cyanobacterium SM2_3_1]|nr:hypothetical protein [Synechococcaceae cyanobacterium SM2_3_1]